MAGCGRGNEGGGDQRMDGRAVDGIADAGQRAHEPYLDALDGFIGHGQAHGALFFHGQNYPMDQSAPNAFGVEKGQMAVDGLGEKR